MKIPVEVVNAFIDGDVGGNAAGVVLDANSLTTEQKLAVAQKIGLSETAFVSNSDIATIKLEFFTPERQIAHCGHATIATFSRLRELGLISDGKMSKETIDGLREIIVDGDMSYMEQKAPSYNSVDNEEQIAESLNSSVEKLSDICIVNTGNSFLLARVKDNKTLRSLEPNLESITTISEQYDLIGYYIYTTKPEAAKRHATTRMFAPRYGIEEESATGMAAGPLACYLREKLGVRDNPIYIEQGNLMTPSSPSVIRVDLKLEKETIVSLMAGGKGKSTKQVLIEV